MVSTDTVEVLTDLLTRAQSGEVLGLAVVAMQKRRTYEFALTG
jgi:hypothetical protein